MKPIHALKTFLWVNSFILSVISCASKDEKAPPSVSRDFGQPPAKAAEAADSSAMTFSQKEGFWQLDWKALAKTKFNPTFVDSIETYVLIPQFPRAVRQLEGQPVEMSGYVIPVEETGDMQVLVLSANPYTTCFFCGQAGPETVMDIKLKNPDVSNRRFKKDETVAFRGKLKLNTADYQFFNYILEDAVEVK